ncbi:hypothetical protein IW148_001815 [Coemansia sp. RSA 1199]|nr:hypothetical protein IW148_001815 [Coemansia sp. RSA 1199]
MAPVAADNTYSGAQPGAPKQMHTVVWALAESHFRQAQQLYKKSRTAASSDGSWKASVVAGLTCLYSVVRLCESPKDQVKYFGRDLVLDADTEAKTRLRIAQVLGDWGEGLSNRDDEFDDEEERQLKRALMSVPNADRYTETKYAIIATHCRLLLRRGERGWAEQRIKSAFVDAQKRRQYRWSQYFLLELSNMSYENGDWRSSQSALEMAIRQAQQMGDKVGQSVMAVQQLSRLVQQRDWTGVAALVGSLVPLIGDSALANVAHVRVRFWVLNSAAATIRGNMTEAQESCTSAREALKQWQGSFARQFSEGRAADGGATFSMSSRLSVCGWSYYEAHAWVMVASALAARGDGSYDRASGFLRLALEGIARGEADSMIRQLLPLKISVLLHIVDINLAALYIGEAKQALDRVMSVIDECNTNKSALWRSTRDAIALRWAMYKHRAGDFEDAMKAYRCVASRGPRDLCYAARVNMAVLYLTSPELSANDTDYLRQIMADLEKSILNVSGSEHDIIRRALLEFTQGMDSKEPVKAKTHLLACLRLCSEAADSVLQGWTLCLLGTMVLSTGQYDQAMKMCAAGQSIAQRANDPLQNAAAIGILTQIEKAVGDGDRHAKLLQVDEQMLQRFNAQISDA